MAQTKTVWIFPVIFFALVSGITPAYAQSNTDLEAIAINKKLDFHPMWHRLLHYKMHSFFGVRSEISDPKFFLSASGRTHSQNEMVETLRAFFNRNTLGDDHAICRFPARLNWLQEQLKNHSAWNGLPKPICVKQEAYKKSLDAESVSFVFSSYYANNPSSAFGHTFFRVNRKTESTRVRQELLDYGLSYAAEVNTDNPFLYVFRGLSGGFKGTMNTVAYYYKVREYNGYENRDLWSYELNLSATELNQLLNHIWEVGTHYYDYFFLTQNCSYPMLTLLEAASSRISLTDKVHFYVIPSDTVRALYAVPDLVKRVDYRPSQRRYFEQKWGQLNDSEKKNFISIASKYSDEKLKSLSFSSQERKAFFYDTLIDYANMQDPRGIVKQQGSWFQLRQSTLVHRAEIPVVSEADINITPEEERPDRAHPSTRLGTGAGQSSGKEWQILKFRFAYHDLLDRAQGMPQKTQMEVGAFDFTADQGKLYLQNFSVFNILQLNPVSALEQKLSWGIDVGIKSNWPCSASESCLGMGFQLSGGYALGSSDHTVWLLPSLRYLYGDSFNVTPHFLSVGYQLGYLMQWTQKLKILGTYNKEVANRYGANDFAAVKARFNISASTSLNPAMELEYNQPNLKQADARVSIIGYLYF